MQAAMCLKIFLEMPKDSFSLQKKNGVAPICGLDWTAYAFPNGCFPLRSRPNHCGRLKTGDRLPLKCPSHHYKFGNNGFITLAENRNFRNKISKFSND